MSPRKFFGKWPALAVLAAFFAGCASPPPQATRVPKVTVEWIGHHCFRLTSSLGIVLVTDPFDPKRLSYPVPANFRAAIVTVSHESELANHLNLVENSPQIIRTNMGVGSNRASGLLIRGVSTSPAPNGVGSNVSYSWEMDGVRFCHLGPITGPIRPEDAQALGRPDVLFLPVGNPSTLNESARDKILELLQPRIVVPMGYRTRHTSRIAATSPGPWLASQHGVRRMPGNRFSVTRDTLPFGRTVLVLATP